MKKILLSIALLGSVLTANATVACITNVTIHALNGWTFTVTGNPSGCYTANTAYTNLSCGDMLSSSCQDGPVIIFSTTNCPSAGGNVATILWQCNQGAICAMTEGGPSNCGPGDNFDLSVSAGVNMIAIRVYPSGTCCHIDKCEIFRINCNYGGGGGEQ